MSKRGVNRPNPNQPSGTPRWQTCPRCQALTTNVDNHNKLVDGQSVKCE